VVVLCQKVALIWQQKDFRGVAMFNTGWLVLDPVGPWPAVAALCVAVLVSKWLVRLFGVPPAQGRFAPIDGLRGYLAFLVFVHHSSFWYFYLRTGQWRAPPSNLYNNFGQGSVVLFFMITGFLFFTKLLDARAGGVRDRMDWGRFFVSRFLRLMPLYVLAMVALLMIVALMSGGALAEPWPVLLKNTVRWLGLTILGAPDLNGVPNTFTIMAGVTWSLPYEVFFYGCLPLLAVLVGIRAPLPYWLIGLISAAGLAKWQPMGCHLLAFLGGLVAAVLVRGAWFRRWAVGPVASVVLLACLACALTMFPSAYENRPLLLLAVAFALMAGGNGLFGVLLHPVSRFLGEMAYSIYLLHGMVLFVALAVVLGPETARGLSALQHWLLVVALVPVVVVMSFATFQFVERPAMAQTNAVTAWWRLHWQLARGRVLGPWVAKA
jgi:peptidoglycan/LPS O-acetylase OafA/YrhL